MTHASGVGASVEEGWSCAPDGMELGLALGTTETDGTELGLGDGRELVLGAGETSGLGTTETDGIELGLGDGRELVLGADETSGPFVLLLPLRLPPPQVLFTTHIETSMIGLSSQAVKVPMEPRPMLLSSPLQYHRQGVSDYQTYTEF